MGSVSLDTDPAYTGKAISLLLGEECGSLFSPVVENNQPGTRLLSGAKVGGAS